MRSCSPSVLSVVGIMQPVTALVICTVRPVSSSSAQMLSLPERSEVKTIQRPSLEKTASLSLQSPLVSW